VVSEARYAGCRLTTELLPYNRHNLWTIAAQMCAAPRGLPCPTIRFILTGTFWPRSRGSDLGQYVQSPSPPDVVVVVVVAVVVVCTDSYRTGPETRGCVSSVQQVPTQVPGYVA
jgi:hypothetical protein